MKVLCFGSLNIDYTYRVDHFVGKGETLAAESLQVFSGGKGLNQAVALARAGAETWMAGAVGEDGRFLLEELAAAGIDALAAFIREIGLPTTLRELGVEDRKQLREIAASCHYSPGGYRRLDAAEVLEIFEECF